MDDQVSVVHDKSIFHAMTLSIMEAMIIFVGWRLSDSIFRTFPGVQTRVMFSAVYHYCCMFSMKIKQVITNR